MPSHARGASGAPSGPTRSLLDQDLSKEPHLEAVSLEFWGIVLREPTTTLTNLLLALECWVLFRRLQPAGMPRPIPDGWEDHRETAPDRARSWSGFFFFLAFATLLGAAKHGIPHYLPGVLLFLAVFASSLASGLSVLHAEATTIGTYAQRPSLRRWLRRGALGKLAALILAALLTPSIATVMLDTTLGLVPIMLMEYGAFRRGRRDSGWVVAGVAFSSLAALVYLLGIPSHPWFDQKDLAHLLMMGTLIMIYLGVRKPPQPS